MTSAYAEWRDGWRVVLGSLIGIALGMSAMGATYTLGLFVAPLAAEFHWSRGDILGVVLAMSIALIPAGPVIGWITDRIGAFRLILVSQCAFGLCFIALGLLVHSLLSLYLVYVALAVLGSGTLPITFGKLIAASFARQRGLALGIALSGTGLCALTVPPLAAAILERAGWRAAYVALGLLPLCIAAPLSWALLRRSRESALDARPDGNRPRSVTAGPTTLVRALHTYRFWAISLSFFLISGCVTGVLTNLVPLLTDRGQSLQLSSATLSAFGVAVIVGRAAAGALFDRVWAPAVGACFLALAATAMWMLGAGQVAPLLVLPSVLAVGIATGMELDLSAYLTARYFGVAGFGQVYGAVFALLLVGGGIAAPLFGTVHDATGSYALALQGGALVLVAAAALLLTLGAYPEAHATPGELDGEHLPRAADA